MSNRLMVSLVVATAFLSVVSTSLGITHASERRLASGSGFQQPFVVERSSGGLTMWGLGATRAENAVAAVAISDNGAIDRTRLSNGMAWFRTGARNAVLRARGAAASADRLALLASMIRKDSNRNERSSAAIWMLTARGVPVNEFGTAGRLVTRFGCKSFESRKAKWSNDRFVVIGFCDSIATLAVVGPTGALESKTSLPGDRGDIMDVATDENGSVILAFLRFEDGKAVSEVVKLTPDFEFDSTFGSVGVVAVPQINTDDAVVRGLVFNGEQILLAGVTERSGFVLRMTSDGALDKTFAGDGVATLPRSTFRTVRSSSSAIVAFGSRVRLTLDEEGSISTGVALALDQKGRRVTTVGDRGMVPLPRVHGADDGQFASGGRIVTVGTGSGDRLYRDLFSGVFRVK